MRRDILEVIGWVSPESAKIVASVDMVAQVSSPGFRRALRKHLVREAS